MKYLLPLVLLAVSLPARASDKTVRLTGGPKSEEVLRRFVTRSKALKAKLDDAAAREEAFLAESRDSDLRDAVSDTDPGAELQCRLATATGDDRARALESLPGMKAAPVAFCATLASCPAPELAADVSDAEQLPEALRQLVRPWMLLQQARGSEAVVSAAPGSGDAALVVTLRDLDAPRLTLNVSPRLLGGFKVWFDEPLVLASLYGRERDAALKPSRR